MADSSGDVVPWRELRQKRGLTQQDVADALGQLAWTHGRRKVGVNADMVSKWERGEKSPSAFYRRLLGLLFDAPVTVLSPSSEPADSTAARAPVGSLPVDQRLRGYDPILQPALAQMWEEELVKRRSLLKLMGAMPLAGSEGVAESVLQRAVRQPVLATPDTVCRLRQLSADYQRLYHTAEPTELIVPVLAFGRTSSRLLTERLDPAVRRDLLEVHGQVALLAGRIAFFDLHDRSTAVGHFALAFDAARELEAQALAAAALGHMAFVPAAELNWGAATEYLWRSHRHADRAGIPLLSSWSAAVESEILTMSGQPSRAMDALERAGAAAESATRSLPSWFDFYDTARLQGFRGYTLLQNGRNEEARQALEHALAGLPATAVKQRSVVLVDQATAHLRLDDLPLACDKAGDAAAELHRAGYATGTDRLRQFRAGVEPLRQHRAVRELDVRLTGR